MGGRPPYPDRVEATDGAGDDVVNRARDADDRDREADRRDAVADERDRAADS